MGQRNDSNATNGSSGTELVEVNGLKLDDGVSASIFAADSHHRHESRDFEADVRSDGQTPSSPPNHERGKFVSFRLFPGRLLVSTDFYG